MNKKQLFNKKKKGRGRLVKHVSYGLISTIALTSMTVFADDFISFATNLSKPQPKANTEITDAVVSKPLTYAINTPKLNELIETAKSAGINVNDKGNKSFDSLSEANADEANQIKNLEDVIAAKNANVNEIKAAEDANKKIDEENAAEQERVNAENKKIDEENAAGQTEVDRRNAEKEGLSDKTSSSLKVTPTFAKPEIIEVTDINMVYILDESTSRSAIIDKSKPSLKTFVDSLDATKINFIPLAYKGLTAMTVITDNGMDKYHEIPTNELEDYLNGAINNNYVTVLGNIFNALKTKYPNRKNVLIFESDFKAFKETHTGQGLTPRHLDGIIAFLEGRAFKMTNDSSRVVKNVLKDLDVQFIGVTDNTGPDEKLNITADGKLNEIEKDFIYAAASEKENSSFFDRGEIIKEFVRTTKEDELLATKITIEPSDGLTLTKATVTNGTDIKELTITDGKINESVTMSGELTISYEFNGVGTVTAVVTDETGKELGKQVDEARALPSEKETFTPKPHVTANLKDHVEVPEAKQFNVDVNGLVVNDNPTILLTVSNKDNQSLINKIVPKGSTSQVTLSGITLKAGHTPVKTVTYHLQVPKGFEVDQELIKSSNTDVTFNFDKLEDGVITATLTEEAVLKLNEDLAKDATTSNVIVEGVPANDGGTYTFNYDMVITLANDETYTTSAKKVTVYTPGLDEKTPRLDDDKKNVTPNDNVIQPVLKALSDEELKQGSQVAYELKHDFNQYNGITASKEDVLKNFVAVIDYDDAALNGDSVKVNSITINGKDVKELYDVHTIDSLSNLSEELQAILKASEITAKEGMVVLVPKDTEKFFTDYVSKGLDVTYNLSFDHNDDFNGDVVVKAYQVDFANGYYSNEVSNTILKPEEKPTPKQTPKALPKTGDNNTIIATVLGGLTIAGTAVVALLKRKKN